MRIIRFVLSLLMLTTVAGVTAQQTQRVVDVDGKKCVMHTIAEGDTFYSLAKRYDVPLKQIVELNGKEDAEKLLPGKVVYIPYVESVAKRSSRDGVVDMDSMLTSTDGEFIIHTITQGDTLYSVAKSYKISLEQLIADNPSAVAESLELGGTLLVRSSKVGYATIKDIDKEIKHREKSADASKPKYHTVAYGDTLYSLARRYKTTEEQLMYLNDITSPDELLSGMTIMVRGTKPVKQDVQQVADDVVGEEFVVDAEMVDELVAEMAEEDVTEIAEEVNAKLEAEQPEMLLWSRTDSLIHYLASGGFNTKLEEENRRMVDSLEQVNDILIPSFRRMERGDTLNVVALLPMHRNGKSVSAFVDLYRGMLLALQDLHRDGYMINLSVFDTERSAARVAGIVEYDEVKSADLILGPIYNEELELVLPVAEQLNIPVVTPLSDIDSEVLTSPVLFQMQADSKYKYEKYAHILDGSYEINIIYGPTNDADYEVEVLKMTDSLSVRMLNAKIGANVGFRLRNPDGSDGASVSASSLVRGAGKKAIVILADRDYDIGEILKAIGSQAHTMGVGGKNDCVVIGNREWDRLKYVDREGFFTSRISIIAPYNSKRTDNNAIKLFESRFLQTYGILPTPYACRGYDAAMLFCTKMFAGLDKYILLERLTPLATPYQFKFEDGMFINSEWVNIQYNSDFTITYK